jgi:hypothetical protein
VVFLFMSSKDIYYLADLVKKHQSWIWCFLFVYSLIILFFGLFDINKY